MASQTPSRFRSALLEYIATLYDPAVLRRGNDYWRRGAVDLVRSTGKRITAHVFGSRIYRVRIDHDKPQHRLILECDCPYFQDQADLCKHLWATLRVAGEDGLLEAAEADPHTHVFVRLDGEELLLDEGGFDPRARADAAPRTPAWQQVLLDVSRAFMKESQDIPHTSSYADRQLAYAIDIASAQRDGRLVVQLKHRKYKSNGKLGRLVAQHLPSRHIPHMPDAADRQVLSLLLGAKGIQRYTFGFTDYSEYSAFELPTATQASLVRLLCETGRCYLLLGEKADDPPPLQWDDGEPWQFRIEAKTGGDNGKAQFTLAGVLRRDDGQTMPLTQPLLLTQGGLLFTDTHAALYDHAGAYQWVAGLRSTGEVRVPASEATTLLEALATMPGLPPLDLPRELQCEHLKIEPRPMLTIRPPKPPARPTDPLLADLAFDYDGTLVPHETPTGTVFDAERRRLISRSAPAEMAAHTALDKLGFRIASTWAKANDYALRLPPQLLDTAVKALVELGWKVEAEGRRVRQAGEVSLRVTSGVDWFELHGQVDFGDVSASLPELLKALQRGQNMVTLDDGTVGLLPEQWLEKYGLLASIGEAKDDHLRFKMHQGALLDALLAAQPDATCDAAFDKLRRQLRSFEGVEPAQPPDSFVGELRPYQRDGLGWLQFLQQFSFGGCLADDMGLGKTVQVLALLESRRRLRAASNGRKTKADAPPTSLIVVPRSLLFNWRQEAARFTPQLSVLTHFGIDRIKAVEHLNGYDVVLTTYGTLRRDAPFLKDARFDYVILDEAQAIKNASTDAAKAARLMRGDHRLALSGTPIENHIGELWSLFEFLNPGMLGSASVLRLGAGSGSNGSSAVSEDTRRLLSRALKPFILRRTKQQVLADLPPKQEQTLYCELENKQRKLYNELRDHYRQSLLSKIEAVGLNKSKMHVLEALLRLRQAACHPGLIDKQRADEPCAKFEMLLPQLEEVLDEGHKALVFSQFTSLLSLVRDRLDAKGVTYEYLDGRTRNRQERVERFQTDPACKLFLISLKAGGLGLNLTAANYVFLLDPWWNPAAESQAIDRAHRIGQNRNVFAYRLIARDTIEEKVLELQQTKRDLADAIITADNSLIRSLDREDLELLLS